MANFKISLSLTLKEEGGWTELDGGTYRGIVRKLHPLWPGWIMIDRHVQKIGRPLKQGEVIKDIHLDALVASFYRSNYWSFIRGDDIECQEVGNILFDWTVTSWDDGVRALQKIVCVEMDGKIGPISLKAINDKGCSITDEFRHYRVEFYRNVKGDNSKYSQSWIDRAMRI